MGNKFSESAKEASTVAYKVVKGDNDTPRVDIDGRLYTPQEISAMILQVFFNYILTLIESMTNDMEDSSISLLDIIVKHEKK